jgi:hypothetical protein
VTVEHDKALTRLRNCLFGAAFPSGQGLETVKNPVRFTVAAAARDRVMQGARTM